MFIDQDEIDTLLAQADSLAEEAASAITASAGASGVTPANPSTPPRPPRLTNDPSLRRILRIRVPVIVQLARQPMSIGSIRKFAPGVIIEFEKSVDEDLELLVNNRAIGGGTCVKVGENFGLRIVSILDKAQRVRSLGPQA